MGSTRVPPPRGGTQEGGTIPPPPSIGQKWAGMEQGGSGTNIQPSSRGAKMQTERNKVMGHLCGTRRSNNPQYFRSTVFVKRGEGKDTRIRPSPERGPGAGVVREPLVTVDGGAPGPGSLGDHPRAKKGYLNRPIPPPPTKKNMLAQRIDVRTHRQACMGKPLSKRGADLCIRPLPALP